MELLHYEIVWDTVKLQSWKGFHLSPIEMLKADMSPHRSIAQHQKYSKWFSTRTMCYTTWIHPNTTPNVSGGF